MRHRGGPMPAPDWPIHPVGANPGHLTPTRSKRQPRDSAKLDTKSKTAPNNKNRPYSFNPISLVFLPKFYYSTRENSHTQNEKRKSPKLTRPDSRAKCNLLQNRHLVFDLFFTGFLGCVACLNYPSNLSSYIIITGETKKILSSKRSVKRVNFKLS